MAENDWQARARQRKRRIAMVVGAMFAAGLLAGLLIGFFEEDGAGLFASDSIPPSVAILAAAGFVISVTFGSWKLTRMSDELDRSINNRATVIAGHALLIGYPTWFFLWKGGLVMPPDAFWLFCGAMAASLIGYLWLKLR